MAIQGAYGVGLAGYLVMGCLDCHNRPAHKFGTTPERAVDAALGEGLINPKIPFVRREAVRSLSAAYPNHDVALPQIERTMRDALSTRGRQGFTEADLNMTSSASCG